MHTPRISLIAAITAKNRAIGKDNKLLWHISEDLQRFKTLTLGKPVIMGKKTFLSLGRPLPGRTNIVLTLPEDDFESPGCFIVHSLNEAIDKAKEENPEEIFFIGGGMIYSQALPLADRLYLTLVKGDYEADTFFPDYSAFTKVVSRKESHDDKYQYAFVVLEK